jgi:hypothetical protein
MLPIAMPGHRDPLVKDQPHVVEQLIALGRPVNIKRGLK